MSGYAAFLIGYRKSVLTGLGDVTEMHIGCSAICIMRPYKCSDDKHPSTASLVSTSDGEYSRSGKYIIASFFERDPNTVNINTFVMVTVSNCVGQEKIPICFVRDVHSR